MKITGAIFDMDGTLLNSMDYWGLVADEYLKGLGIFPESDTCQFFLEQGMASWHKMCVEKYALSEPLEITKAKIYALMDTKYETEVDLKDGARELLDTLRDRGVKMCLATATDRASVEKILRRLGIDGYFSRIFTSSEVGEGKRKPLIYEKALEYLGTDKETTYVFEDAHYAIVTAHNAGFNVIGIYDRNVYESKEEIRSLCTYYLDEGMRYDIGAFGLLD